MITGGRRILALLALGAVGTLAALSISTSLALFSATGAQQTNSFASGTVTLTSSSDSTCQLTQPTSTCTYKIDYTGSLPAWIGLDVSGSSGVQITDGTENFTTLPDQVIGASPVANGFTTTVTVACPSTPSSPSACTKELHDCSRGSDNQDDTGDTQSQQEKDGDRDDKPQCAAVAVTLQAHAVQAANNTNGTDTGPVSWS